MDCFSNAEFVCGNGISNGKTFLHFSLEMREDLEFEAILSLCFLQISVGQKGCGQTHLALLKQVGSKQDKDLLGFFELAGSDNFTEEIFLSTNTS